MKMYRSLMMMVVCFVLLSACGTVPQSQSVKPIRLTASTSVMTGTVQHGATSSDSSITGSPEPTDSKGYTNRGVAWYQQGEFRKAIEDYTRAIELDANNVEAYVNRGSAYVRANDHDNALKDYDKAITLNPNLAESYAGRGAIYYLNKQFPESIADFTKAISIKPDFTGAYYNRGLVYVETQDNEKAIADFKKIVELGSDPFWKQQAESMLNTLQEPK